MEYIYGALLLHKLGQPVTEEALKKVVNATGIQADEVKVKALISSLQGIDIAAELANASSMAAAPTTTPAAKEEKKEEKVSESAAGLSALFG